MSALVRFIIRRLPLVSEKATDPEYRTLHPYTCSSEQEYLDSNVGKQRALEVNFLDVPKKVLDILISMHLNQFRFSMYIFIISGIERST